MLLMAFQLSFSEILISQGLNPKPANDSTISEIINQVNADSVENYIRFLEDMGTRFMIAPNRKEVAEAIEEKFNTLGIENTRIDSFYSYTSINYHNLNYDTSTTQYNVVATIPGLIDYDQFVVMGAHYDCVVAPEGDPMVFAPGADDNASGVAALFEVARILSLNEYQPEKTIEFVAFGAEELMHYGYSGAHAYVDSAMTNGINLDMMINNDMIAYDTSQWRINISNYIGCEWLTTIAEQITSNYTDLEPLVRSPSSNAGADCKYFYEAGVPCVYFMEDIFNPNYHSNEDLLANCDVGYCAEAIKISLGVLLAIEDTTTTFINDDRKLAFKVYPNPSSGQFKIGGIKQNEHIYYHIYDLNGRIVKSGSQANINQSEINISHLPNGLYILRCVSSETTFQTRIALNKY